MSDNNTFKSFPTLLNSLIQADLREELITYTWEHRQQIPNGKRTKLENLVQRYHSGNQLSLSSKNELPKKLIDKIVVATSNNLDLFGAILEIWVETQPALRNAIQACITRGQIERSWDNNSVRVSIANFSELTLHFKRSDIYVMGLYLSRNLPMKESSSLENSISSHDLSELVKKPTLLIKSGLTNIYKNWPEQIAEKLDAVLTEQVQSQLEIQQMENITRDASISSEKPLEINSLWQDWINILNRLPAEAEEWITFDNFLAEVSGIADRKKEENSAATVKLTQALTNLLENGADLLDNFDKLELVKSWEARKCNPGKRSQIASSTEELLGLLLQFEQLDRQKPAKIAGRTPWQKELDNLAETINTTFADLENCFTVSIEKKFEQAAARPQAEEPAQTSQCAFPQEKEIIPEQLSEESFEIEAGLGLVGENLPALSQDQQALLVASEQNRANLPGTVELVADWPVEKTEPVHTPGTSDISEIEAEPVEVTEKAFPIDSSEYLNTGSNSHQIKADLQAEKINLLLAELPTIETSASNTEIKQVAEPKPEFESAVPLPAEMPAAVAQVRKTGDERTSRATQDIAAALPVINLEITAAGLAESILNGDTSSEDKARKVQLLIWLLLRESRPGLAYHLAVYLESTYPDLQPQLPAVLLQAQALGPQIVRSDGELARALSGCFANINPAACFYKGEHDWNNAIKLLIVAATLRPALLVPIMENLLILDDLRFKGHFDNLYQYCQIIVDFGNNLTPLDLAGLKKAKANADWQENLEQVINEADHWFTNTARKINFTFYPAGRIWKHWQNEGELLYDLLLPIRQNNVSQLDIVRQTVVRLADDSEIRRELINSQKAAAVYIKTEDQIKFAVRQLQENLRQSLELARRWLDLHQEHKTGKDSRSHYQKQLVDLRDRLLEQQDQVFNELAWFERQTDSIGVKAAVTCCRNTIKGIKELFNNDDIDLVGEEYPEYLLNLDLLRVPGLNLNDKGEPLEADLEITFEGILKLVASNRYEWEEALTAHNSVANCNHAATGLIIKYLGRHQEQVGTLNLEVLEQQRERSIRQCRLNLTNRVNEVRRIIEKDFSLGIIDWLARNKYTGKIEIIEQSIPQMVHFSEAHSKLQAILNDLQVSRQVEVKKTRQRLEILDLPANDPGYVKVTGFLDNDNMLLANEYLDRIENKELPEEPGLESKTFNTFFPGMVNSLHAVLKSRQLTAAAIYQRYGQKQSFAGLTLSGLTSTQAVEAEKVVKNWLTIEKNQKAHETVLRPVVNGLGFEVIRFDFEESKGDYQWAKVTTQKIDSKKHCPVAQYGSAAKGKYQILCIWNYPGEDELISLVKEKAHLGPVIVLYFGLLAEMQRRQLGHDCRAEQTTFLLVDDILIMYLSSLGSASARLTALFECTLPFTFLNPYITTAGLAAPEMFFGRKNELQQIIDTNGTCFIYGGRQLGKTALLREIERRYHRPEQGWIVRWIDLKAKEIGNSRSADDIWFLLAQELKENKIIPDVPINTGPDKLLEYVKNWLNKDQSYRIILLLDEADRFLEEDGLNYFSRSARLKGWMDQTDRRFKIVFTGLHNVLRTTKQQNHPLAHYGTPICIGPLLERREWMEASALIQQPLALLGYQFDKENDPVTYILSRTNYYPSLIQAYCSELVRELTVARLAIYSIKKTPSYLITSRQVEEVYQTKNLREFFKRRLIWTLELDPRYEVIAYSIIRLFRLQSQLNSSDVFEVSEIRKEVNEWWPNGFETNNTNETFKVLLDEMVGLGILRSTSSEHYALRSHNVASLIGTLDEIEEKLVSTANWENPLAYQAEYFRAAYHSKLYQDLTRRNPLTNKHMNELRRLENKVAVIFGIEAAGINDLVDFFKTSFGEDSFKSADTASNLEAFSQRLDSIVGERAKDTNTVIFVSAISPWDAQWVDKAVQKLKNLKSPTSFVKVVFVANPSLLWELLQGNLEIATAFSERGVITYNLGAWHDVSLRQWLNDCELSNNPTSRDQVAKEFGNWPYLLQRFYARIKDTPEAWQQNLAKVSEYIISKPETESLLTSFGLDKNRQQARNVLHYLAEIDMPLSMKELVEEGYSQDLASLVLRWAHLLKLILPFDNDKWVLDSTLAKILRMSGE